jgi:hypothetical protein
MLGELISASLIYGTGGDTVLENIHQVPVDGGTNVFKRFGQSNGGENYSGLYQDLVAVSGQEFTAQGLGADAER